MTRGVHVSESGEVQLQRVWLKGRKMGVTRTDPRDPSVPFWILVSESEVVSLLGGPVRTEPDPFALHVRERSMN